MANWLDIAGSISPAYLLGWGISELIGKKSLGDALGDLFGPSPELQKIYEMLLKMQKAPSGLTPLTPEEKRSLLRQRDIAALNLASSQALSGTGGTGLAQAQKADLYTKFADTLTKASLAKTADERQAWLAELQKLLGMAGVAGRLDQQSKQWMDVLMQLGSLAGQTLPYLL